MRRTGHRSAVERAMVGDTKTSMVRDDHLGWLKCDGRELLKSEYVTLYAVLGDSFGVASSPDKFVLPDALGRVMGLIGQALPNADPSSNVWVDGDICGEETHTLTIAEMPAHNHDICGGQLNTDNSVDPSDNGYTSFDGIHNHTITDPGHAHSYVNNINNAAEFTGNGNAAADDDISQTTGSATTGISIQNSVSHRHQIASNGGSLPHNNMQPTLFLGNLFIFSGRPTFGAFDTVGSAGPNYFPPRIASRLY